MIIYLYQILLFLIPLIVFGLLIGLIKRLFVKMLGRPGYKILLVTGIIGTPIHELSHALFCLIFAHKIHEIKLYDPKATDGALGYVKHSYNKKNIYQQIGNFFIGIGPIIGGTAVLILLMWIMTPSIFNTFTSNITMAGSISINGFSISTMGDFFTLLINNLLAIFNPSNFKSVLYWIYLIIAISITSHMELSPADIKGSLSGLVLLLVLILVLDFIIPNAVSSVILFVSLYSLSFLSIAVVFSLVLLILGLVLRIFIRR